MNRGIVYALCAYGLWGLLPIYWKLLHAVPASQILGNRVAWSFLFMAVVLTYRKQWQWVQTLRTDPSTTITFAVVAGLIGLNWFTYIWAVNAGFIVETSLGYFITPLMNVLLGVVVLRERVRPWQWIAVAVAAAGVLYLTVSYGALPWIALTLASTFSIYGLLKKRARLDAFQGLSLEMTMLLPFALAYLIWLEVHGMGALGHQTASTNFLLIASGAVTAVPLLLFAAGARRIPLTTLGFLQYVAPTLQVMLGVFVYNEPFTETRIIGFGVIWTALLIYSIDSVVSRRKRTKLRPVPLHEARGA
jgi:chloramphenicol-sensitive protein RarD